MFSNAIKFMDRMYIGANGCDRATAFTSGYLSPIPHIPQLVSQNLVPQLKCFYLYNVQIHMILIVVNDKLSDTSCTTSDCGILCKRYEEMESILRSVDNEFGS